MTDPIQALFPPSEGEELKEWYRSNVVGTYVSNWEFLRASAASAFLQAFRALHEVTGAWQSGRESGQRDGQTSTVAFMNYRIFASGPLLAATLMPAFSLEAFARHSLEIGIRRQVTGLEAFELAIGKADSLPFANRLSLVADLAGADPVPQKILESAKALFEFRNAVAHDAPMLRDEFGNLLRVKHGKIKQLPEEAVFRGQYPVLALSSMPLQLEHAKRAVDTHDEFVDHLRGKSDRNYWRDFMESFGNVRTESVLIKDLGGSIWRDWEGVDSNWAKVLEWDDDVSEGEREDYLRDLMRKQVVRAVREESSPDGEA